MVSASHTHPHQGSQKGRAHKRRHVIGIVQQHNVVHNTRVTLPNYSGAAYGEMLICIAENDVVQYICGHLRTTLYSIAVGMVRR